MLGAAPPCAPQAALLEGTASRAAQWKGSWLQRVQVTLSTVCDRHTQPDRLQRG